jgi:hypothetical protein
MSKPRTELLPEPEREPFKQNALVMKEKYASGIAFQLALADAFESLVGIQDDLTLPQLGQALEREIFSEFALGNLPEV